MDALITQIKDLASTADEAGRKKLQDALRDVQYSLETPWDTALRLGGMVSMLDSDLPLNRPARFVVVGTTII